MYRKLSPWLFILVMLCWASPAMAQRDAQSFEENPLGWIILISTAPTSTTFGGASLAIKWRESDLEDEIKHLKTIVMIQQFLDHNERQVEMGLALGAGKGLRDLTALIDDNVTFTPSLGRHLRKNRRVLRAILQQKSTLDRAEKFYRAFYGVMMQQPKQPVTLLLKRGGQQ